MLTPLRIVNNKLTYTENFDSKSVAGNEVPQAPSYERTIRGDNKQMFCNPLLPYQN